MTDLQSHSVRPAVEFSRVSKSYSIYAAPGDRLKELATFNQRRFHTDYWALRDVSFEVARGETFCIVGENGSGKSTLLQICAGILQPTAGTATVNGRVAALLELGSGFNPEFSGRDNVYLNGAILGLSAKEMDRRFPEIEAFAEIGDFIDQPVKTYSSGMVVRLAFAVAIHVDPEILLVDEALAVGDVYFRQRCMRKVHELRARGSHDSVRLARHRRRKSAGRPGAVAGPWPRDGDWEDGSRGLAISCCDGAKGRHLPGPSTPSCISREPYRSARGNRRRHSEHRSSLRRRPRGDPRDRRAAIATGSELSALQPDSTIVVRISVRAKANLDRPIVGFMFRNHLGVDFAGTNTAREGYILPPLLAGEVCTVDFYVELPALYASLSPSRPRSPMARWSTTPCATGSTTRSSCRWNDPTGRSTDSFISPAAWR